MGAAAYDETDGGCVSHQLSKHIRIKGREAPWTQRQVAEMLLHATDAVYDESEGDPYDGGDPNKIGYTAAAIMQLCRDLGVSVHIKWGNGSKIESFTPAGSQYEEIALYIWGATVYVSGTKPLPGRSQRSQCPPRRRPAGSHRIES